MLKPDNVEPTVHQFLSFLEWLTGFEGYIIGDPAGHGEYVPASPEDLRRAVLRYTGQSDEPPHRIARQNL